MSCTFKLFTRHFECMLTSQRVWEVAKCCDFQKCPVTSSVFHRWKQNPLSVGIFDKFGDLQKFTKIYGLWGYPTNGAIKGPVPGNFCQKAESRRLSANLSKKDTTRTGNQWHKWKKCIDLLSNLSKKIGRDSTSKLGEKKLFQLHPNLEEILSFISKENPIKAPRFVSPVKFFINSWCHRGAFQSNGHLSRWHGPYHP